LRIALIFIDGVGLGSDDPLINPFVSAHLPIFRSLLDGAVPLASAAPRHTERASLVALDATLGVDGTPQSGTGQTALLTGEDAVQLHGRHFGPWVPARLRTLVREQSILARAQAAGFSVTFANAYPEEALQPASEQERSSHFLRAGPPIAALGAGVLTRHTHELERGDAVASEITNEGWRQHLHRTGVPSIDAQTAGFNLSRIIATHDLTLFAHYSTDYAGHRQDLAVAIAACQLLDAFLGGTIDTMPDDTLVIVTSDHGNIEDCSTGHTRNPAIGLAVGNRHAEITRNWSRITDVAPSILEYLHSG
jgi:hypothetical protein